MRAMISPSWQRAQSTMAVRQAPESSEVRSTQKDPNELRATWPPLRGASTSAAAREGALAASLPKR